MQAIATETHPGVSYIGGIKVRSNEALAAEQETSRPTEQIISDISNHLNSLLSKAKRAKDPVERQMLKNLRQINGVYEPDKLAAIRQMGGSEVYVLLTMTKYRAALAWINDVLRAGGKRLFTLAPTPLADLPPNVHAKIQADSQKVMEMVVDSLLELGVTPDPELLTEEIAQYEREVKDKMRREIQKEAKERAERMATLIEDQFVEGGWDEAFWAVIADLIAFPAAVLKGPVVRKRDVEKWVEKDGEWTLEVEKKLTTEFDRVSPFDWYPLAGAVNIQEGGFERRQLTRNDLYDMIGVPGYSEVNIRKVLREYTEGKRETLPGDTERALLEKGETESLLTSDKIEAWEFWGPIPGRYLQQWGIPVADADRDYEANAWQVGPYTIRAILNPDKLGRKPYSSDSFERIPGSFWGKGLPQLMGDIQDVCNAVARAMVNNSGLASGPQVEVDESRCQDAEEIYPWKIWPSKTNQMSDAPAVRFTQPQIIVDSLLKVYNHFSLMADDQTGVPRWSHGNTNVGGAGDTSSGLSMLMTSAARGIKEVIAHIDKLVESVVGRVYHRNMLFHPDPAVKGDARVIAKASSSLLAKEQKLLRVNEFLDKTNNPVDLQIMQLSGRAKLLRQAAEFMEIDTEGIIPDTDSEINELMAAIAEKEQAMVAAQQPKPKTTDAAGAPAGGTDNNAFQNQEGVRT